MNSSEIRQAFVNYFAKDGHEIVPSGPLVPVNDSTLLFTNAGMVQFKDTLLGIEKRPYSRAVSVQRCVRAGGKHNDLENVGYTARHHTFFEMLGNFSFGDYFKREAIAYSWSFLTKVLKLPAERLWVTVFAEDEEAEHIWLEEIGVSPKRFSRCGEADNFWSMGDTGPCGPCSEIFYDHGPDVAGGPPGTAEADGDRYIEIWNMVFMQYNRDKSGRLHDLPKPSVDTGMGLERIAAVVQGVHSNYEIDSFRHLIRAIANLAHQVDLDNPSLKVIADHIRACAFLIVDGVLPGNEGRGYVLRRIIRRAVRHGYQLGLPTPFFHQLITPLIEVMGAAYPELADNQQQVERILLLEENQFARTLEQGMQLLQDKIEHLKGNILPGDVAFKLYDTYGFPVDLTADIAREQHIEVDRQGFETCMQQQRAKSQAASHFEADYSTPAQLTESSVFKGYDKDSLQSKVIAILQDGNKIDCLDAPVKAAVILDETPFYAESGGQVGDQGQLLADNLVFRVDDTQKIGQAVVQYGELISGRLTCGQSLTAKVDATRRHSIRLNHTATHLLHAALKTIVGAHVQQKGSLVDAERARFDFSHFAALTSEQLAQIEILVNDRIRRNDAVVTHTMELEEAKAQGAVALFGEKYSDNVRVLAIDDFSKELCGGTHASYTGDLGLFKIIAEYGIASGVRRIEMVTGNHALQWVNQQLAIVNHVGELLKTKPAQAPEKLTQLLQDLKSQEKEISGLKSKLAMQSTKHLGDDMQTIQGINLLVKKIDNTDNQALRAMLDQLKSTLDNAVIILYTLTQDKIYVITGISKAIAGDVPGAAHFVRHLCGKGGGRDDMAQGGGAIPKDLQERLSAIPGMLEQHTKQSL